MERHLTATGFVVHEGRTALHWHRKNQMWLPAGGHMDEGEDPVETMLREVREEYGLECEVIPTSQRVGFSAGPGQIEPPYTILNEHVADNHVHVDFVYFCRVLSGYPGVSHDPDSPIVWFDAEQLATGAAAAVDGREMPFPPDVQALGIEAIRLASELAVSPV